MRFRPHFHSINSENLLSLFTAFILGVLLVFKVNVVSLFRPVADDYCFAASLNQGFIHSLIYWYQSVQFDFLVLTSNLFFVGIPIQLFSPNFASLFSFVIMVVIFSAFIARQIGITVSPSRFFSSINIHLLLLISLLSYFWLQPSVLIVLRSIPLLTESPFGAILFKFTQHSLDVTNSWTFWGVVNSSYLVPFLFSLWFILRRFKSRRLHVATSIFCGLLLGTSGYVTVATTLVTILLLHLAKVSNLSWKLRSYRLRLRYHDLLEILPISLSIILGSVISFFSPGGTERRNALKNLPQSAQVSFETLPEDLARISAEVLLNIGNVSSLIFGFLIGITIKKSDFIQFKLIEKLLTTTGVYFIVCFFFTIASEFFSYRAYWHVFTLKYDFFIFLVSLGVYLANMRTINSGGKILLSFIVPIMLICSFIGLVSQIENRYDFWRANRNYGAISSIGDETSWVYGCYMNLKKTNPQKYYPEMKR